MPRYAILEHDHPFPHWDLMLEAGETLRTWRLLKEPAEGTSVPGEAVFDHRPIYLDYEGPISGGRGRVVRWDGGEFDWEVDMPDRLSFHLRSERWSVACHLDRQADGGWLFRVGC